MVLDGEDFEVRDAKSGEDLTRSILLQIILEEETGGAPMFTTQMLAQVIRFYGHAMQGLMGTWLEKNLQAFVEMQNRFAEQSKGLYDVNKFTPEMWARFMSGQDVLDQSRKLIAQMQEQMQKQAETLFPGFPGAKK
jgi:polyhydroxyalkanoate synthesis repressor PhaR